MSYALSLEGLLYNGPALLLLGWIYWRNPPLGLLLAALSFLRVQYHLVPWSMHACVAGAALCLGKWEAVAGIVLLGWTTWFYVHVFEVTRPLALGVGAGLIFGATVVITRWLRGQQGEHGNDDNR